MKFSTRLLSNKEVDDALDEAIDIRADNVALIEELNQDHDAPDRKTIERAIPRLDAATMLIDRLDMRRWMTTDVLVSINLYADASPVTGLEIQGMVIEFVFETEIVKACGFFTKSLQMTFETREASEIFSPSF